VADPTTLPTCPKCDGPLRLWGGRYHCRDPKCGRKWSLNNPTIKLCSSPCAAEREYQKHQWRRVHRKGRYLYECRICGEPKPDPYSHRYLTALGLIEEYFAKPRIHKVRFRQGAYKAWQVDDWRDVKGRRNRQLTGKTFRYAIPKRKETPERRDFKRRYRKVEVANMITVVITRREPIRNTILAEIKAWRQLSPATFERIGQCLKVFDGIVAASSTQDYTKKPNIFLSEDQLRRVAAGAIYHYSNFAWKEILGDARSLYPHLTRSQVSDVWYPYVAKWDRHIRGVPVGNRSTPRIVY
jgi:hypothetical protein